MSGVTESQLIRWGIPGWTMIVMFLSLLFEDSMVRGDLRPFTNVLHLGGSSNLAAVIVTTAAGIPLGYLIYQIYFFFRWNWWGSGRGIMYRWMPKQLSRVTQFIASPGRMDEIEELLKLTPNAAIDAEELVDGSRWKLALFHRVRSDHRQYWALLENLWLNISEGEGTEGSPVVRRSRHLFDTLHGLGAVRWALALGFLLYLVYELHLSCTTVGCPWLRAPGDWMSYQTLARASSTTVTFGFLYVVTTANRNDIIIRISTLWFYTLRSYLDRRLSDLCIVAGDGTRLPCSHRRVGTGQTEAGENRYPERTTGERRP